MDEPSPDLLQAAAKAARALGPEHLVLIGGLAAFLLGVERYTADVDLATDLAPEEVEAKLLAAGLPSNIRRSGADDPLPWVIETQVVDVPLQILPAAGIGADIGASTILDEYGIRLVSVEGFIRSKCFAGGHQDLLDVAILTLKYPDLTGTAEREARRYGVDELLATWRADKRILARYGK